MYKVALYTSDSRYECQSRYANLEEAKLLYSRVCITYSELPLDAICSLEKGDSVLQAYRFTRTFQTFRVDHFSASFRQLTTRLASNSHVKPPPTKLTHRPEKARKVQSVSSRRATSADIGEVNRLADEASHTSIRQRIGRFVKQILGTSKRSR